jgi:hypothetical protein
MGKMVKTIPIKTIRELYRLDNKYWRIGDADILPARRQVAQEIDERFWGELCGIMRMVTQQNYPVEKFIEVIRVLGYMVSEE